MRRQLLSQAIDNLKQTNMSNESLQRTRDNRLLIFAKVVARAAEFRR
jgi:hypothetical protein